MECSAEDRGDSQAPSWRGPGQGEPECNGIMERWIRTLKEECLYLHDFESLEEAREVIGRFIRDYNEEWLLERHGYRTPAETRRELLDQAA